MVAFAIKQIVKDVKVSITGRPVVHAYINQYGQAVAAQKIYVDNVKILIDDEDLSEVTQVSIAPVGKELNNTQMQVLDTNISELFKGFVLQNSTIKLINQLNSTHGILHIKALVKDTLERADNYDSYIFKMLSSSADPKWYALNQSKFIHELNTQDELLAVKNQSKTEYEDLVAEYNQHCSNNNNLEGLKDTLREMIDNRIAYFTSNPQKLVVQVIGLEKNLINMRNKLYGYLMDDYLFFMWLLLNNKSTTEVKNNKLFLNFISDVFKE